MAYIPGGGVSPADAAAYGFQNYGQFNATAYDNSAYADYNNFNQITPFNAWGKLNIWGTGAPPPGMNYGQYTDRLNTLSSRFTNYAFPSMMASTASVLGATAFMYSDVAASALHVASNISGSSGLMRASNAFNFMGETFGKVNSGISAALMAPLQHGIINPASSLIGSFGDDLVGMANRFGGRFMGMNTLGTWSSEGTAHLINKTIETWNNLGIGSLTGADKTAALAKAELAITASKDVLKANGAMGWLAGKALWAPAALAANIGGFIMTQAVLDTVIQGGLNSYGTGIQAEQDKIADTFEGLSDRVLSGASGYKSKRFATDVAQRIRENSFADAKSSGILGTLGISDTAMGRFTGGWSAIKEMQNKTANYALMAESGLLTKSNSADEFIKKADAMYAAIAKLGEALGQTTTKAMETARVLKSQGISSPAGIASAGSTISTSAGITGYSDNQVLALTGEATEAFRGTIFGADLAFNMANSTMRKISMGASVIGDSAYDKLLYTSRGPDSLQVMSIRAAAELTNASELKSMMVASMFKPTENGFTYTGKIDKAALNAAIAGENNYLTNDATLGSLNANFRLRDQAVQRAAEYEMTGYTNNLTDSGRRGMISAVGRMRGYKGNLDLYEQRFREMGLDPVSALNLAKITTADTRSQEANYEYFERKQQQLSNYLEKNNSEFYKSYVSDRFTGISDYTGRYTAALEIGTMMAAGGGAGFLKGGSWGAAIGMGAGFVAGVASNANFFTGIGNRMGIESDGLAMAAGAGSYAAGLSALALAGKAALSPIGLVGIGVGSVVGATGSYLGKELITDKLKASGYSDNNAEFLGRLSGGALTAAGVLTLGTLGVLTAPVAAGYAAVTGAYSLWDAYSNAYLSPDQGLTQRQILRDTMGVVTSVDKLRSVSASSYADMMAMGSVKRNDIETASLEGYYAKATAGEKRFAASFARDMTQAHLARGDNSMSVAVPGMLGNTAYGLAGALSKNSNSLLAGTKYADAESPEKAMYDALSAIKAASGKKGAGVKVGSDEEKLLRRIRMGAAELDNGRKSALITYLNNGFGFDKIRVTDTENNTLFSNFSDYATNSSGRNSFTALGDNITAELGTANTILSEGLGMPEKAGKIITADNAIPMFAVFNALRSGEGLNKALSLGKAAGLDDDAVALLNNALIDSNGNMRLNADAVTSVSKSLSNIGISAPHLVAAESIKLFTRNKSTVLGDDAGTVNAYLKSFVSGGLSEPDRLRISTMAKNNFENIKDLNVAAGLNEIHSTMNAGELLGESAKNNNWTIAQAREKIKAANKLSSTQKDILLASTSGMEGSLSYASNAGKILSNISANVFNSNISEMGKQTAEDLASSQINILSKLDTSIDKMTTAANNLTTAIVTGKMPAPTPTGESPKKVEASAYDAFENRG